MCLASSEERLPIHGSIWLRILSKTSCRIPSGRRPLGRLSIYNRLSASVVNTKNPVVEATSPIAGPEKRGLQTPAFTATT